VEDHWNCYPWDAAAYGLTIDEHEALATVCRGDSKEGVAGGVGDAGVVRQIGYGFGYALGVGAVGAVVGATATLLFSRMRRSE
jgi:hypothetical protein